MRGTPQRQGATSTLLFGVLFLILGIANLAGGQLWRGLGFTAIGLAALLGSPQAHALLGVDYARRRNPLRIAALALAAVSLGSFLAMVIQTLS
jgi:hypothetical protein